MKTFFICLLFSLFLIPCCKKQESVNETNAKAVPFSEIKGPVVYDQNNRETSITGNVVARDINIVSPFMELGIILDGKLDLTFPDIPLGQENRFFSDINLKIPGLDISPQDATWLLFDDSIFLLVFTDEDVPSIFDPRETSKQNYILRFRDQSDEFEVWFAFFTVDTIVKGNSNFFGYTYDVDINVSRGWNIIYVKNLNSNTIIKTSGTNISSIKFFVEKTTTSYGYFYRIP